MISQVTSQNLSESRRAASREQFWPRELVLGLLSLLIGFEILVWTAYLYPWGYAAWQTSVLSMHAGTWHVRMRHNPHPGVVRDLSVAGEAVSVGCVSRDIVVASHATP